MIRCPICKRFAKHIATWLNGFDEICAVVIDCKKHGIRDDGEYDFYEDVATEEREKNELRG